MTEGAGKNAAGRRTRGLITAALLLALAAGMHVAAASPAGFILEYSLGANPLVHDLVFERFTVNGGCVEIPERPGLGITVDESFASRYAVAA